MLRNYCTLFITAPSTFLNCKLKIAYGLAALRSSLKMLEFWNLMDTPLEEQHMFQNVTCNIATSEHEVIEPNENFINYMSYISWRK